MSKRYDSIVDDKDRAEAAEARIAELEESLCEEVGNRERTEAWADKLAAAISDDIGPHSNRNNPWANALQIASEAKERLAAAEARVAELEPPDGHVLADTYGPPSQWRSVEDELPENWEDVLCLEVTSEVLIGYHTPVGWAASPSAEVLAVTHWQPLPAPPEDV